MNFQVPDLEMDEDYSIPSTSSLTFSRSNSSATNSASATATPDTGGATGNSEVVIRKRKCKEIEESVAAITTTTSSDPRNEEIPIEYVDDKKYSRGASTSKRTRAAEVHNLSERRRRDRINEKMKALQELIPRCNKTDKASMLEEAIEYVKALKQQLQMFSMGYGMMHPAMQQYMSPMGMDIGTRPGMQYSPGIPSPLVPTPAPNVMPPLPPRFPIPPYIMPLVPTPQLTLNQPNNPADSSSSPFATPSSGTPYAIQSPGTPQTPNMADPYQLYLACQQMQIQMQQMQLRLQSVQSQTISEPGSSKPGPSKSEGDNEDDVI